MKPRDAPTPHPGPDAPPPRAGQGSAALADVLALPGCALESLTLSDNQASPVPRRAWATYLKPPCSLPASACSRASVRVCARADRCAGRASAGDRARGQRLAARARPLPQPPRRPRYRAPLRGPRPLAPPRPGIERRPARLRGGLFRAQAGRPAFYSGRLSGVLFWAPRTGPQLEREPRAAAARRRRGRGGEPLAAAPAAVGKPAGRRGRAGARGASRFLALPRRPRPLRDRPHRRRFPASALGAIGGGSPRSSSSTSS